MLSVTANMAPETQLSLGHPILTRAARSAGQQLIAGMGHGAGAGDGRNLNARPHSGEAPAFRRAFGPSLVSPGPIRGTDVIHHRRRVGPADQRL
jgi:hypothetical protein